jgi:hypothetical protein
VRSMESHYEDLGMLRVGVVAERTFRGLSESHFFCASLKGRDGLLLCANLMISKFSTYFGQLADDASCCPWQFTQWILVGSCERVHSSFICPRRPQ